ncbi:MAG: PKD domain-containing protein [Bacteroidota bacterium]
MDCKKIALLFVLLLSLLPQGRTQTCNQPNAQYEFPQGLTQFCEGAVVEIDNRCDEENPIVCIDFMVLDWGDGTIDTFPDFDNKIHIYDISDSPACKAEQPPSYGIKLSVVYKNGQSNCIVKFISIFPKPVASFSAGSPNCVSSDPICMDKNACWDSLWNWQIRPLAGGQITTYTEEEPCHSFDAVGTYEIRLIASNICPVDNELQSDTATQLVQVIEEAKAEALVTDGSAAMEADTFIVCLNQGGNIALDGSTNSTNESIYLWEALTSTRNYDWIVDPPSQSNPTVDTPSIVFFQEGIFSVVLTVDNDCEIPDRDTLFFRVIDPEAVALQPQEDACISLDYTPSPPPEPGIAYEINGMLTSSFPVTLGPGQYIVTATLDQSFCGSFLLRDTFVVLQEDTAQIFQADTTICVLDGPFSLLSEPDFGEWRINGALFSGILDPQTAEDGINIITYGNEPCIKTDTIRINIINPDIDMPPPTEVCLDDTDVQFQASPPGGFWFGTAIDSSGRFDPALAGVGRHVLYYRYEDASFRSCADLDSFEVTVTQLFVDFLVDTCENTTVFFDTIRTSSFDLITWDFGDGNTSNQVQASHSYNSVGSYDVSVRIERGACVADTTRTISIESPAQAAFDLDFDPSRCAPLSVGILNGSTGSNLRYRWELNGQLFSTDPNPAPLLLEAFERDSLFDIRLYLRNDCTEDVASQSILVRPQPLARFGSDKDTYCSGDTIPLSNNARGNPDAYAWLLDGVLISTDSVPPIISHQTSVVDTIEICLLVSNDCGMDTTCINVEVLPTDVDALFNLDPLIVCLGDGIFLTNLSTNGAPVWYDLGDGTQTAALNPTHVYADTGTYLIRQQAFGCGFDVYEQSVQVVLSPTASFRNPAFACPGELLRFENQSSADVVEFRWDFGDSLALSALSSLSSPSFTFHRPGSYEVCLTVFSNGDCSDTDCQMVQVFDPPQSQFLFTDSLCLGDPVSFEDVSRGNGLSCFYDFGDGNLSDDCLTQHVYGAAGTYVVTQIVTDGNGCRDTSLQSLVVRDLPQVAFRFEVLQACDPAEVAFFNDSQDASSFLWDFGDGATSAQTNPVHEYLQGGKYVVRLLAGREGICFQERVDTVVIFEQPTADFQFSPNNLCAGDSSLFQSNARGDIVGYEWDFGDGLFSFDPNPSHLYQEADTFQVRLIVRTADGCADTSQQSLIVHPAIDAVLATDSLLCFGDNDGRINLNILAGTAPFSFEWSNGVRTEDVAGLEAGLYSVLINDANACQQELSIQIEQPDSIRIQQLDYQQVDCFGESTGSLEVVADGGRSPYQYEWSNGSDEPLQMELAAGLYVLTVTDGAGCSSVRPFVMAENLQLQPIARVEDISCFGQNDGFLFIDSIRGGVPLYNARLTGPFDTTSLSDRIGFTFSNLRPGLYQLTLSDGLQCQQQYEYRINEPDSIYVSIQNAFPDTIDLGTSYDIITDYNGSNPSFDWQPPDRLSDPTDPEPTATPFRSTTYVINMMDEFGCTASDTLRIPVRMDKNIFIPSGFTPDQNGTNDKFFIRSENPAVQEIQSMQIFNRWGGLVFENTNFLPDREEEGWNGMYKGKLAQQDKYTYVVKVRYIDGSVQAFQGLIQLLLP